jgi:hypothetical protein
LRTWLVEATDKSGALWGFLVRAKRISRNEIVERMKNLGRVIELSGQIVEVARLDLTTVEVKHDATWRRPREGQSYSIEGDELD